MMIGVSDASGTSTVSPRGARSPAKARGFRGTVSRSAVSERVRQPRGGRGDFQRPGDDAYVRRSQRTTFPRAAVWSGLRQARVNARLGMRACRGLLKLSMNAPVTSGAV